MSKSVIDETDRTFVARDWTLQRERSQQTHSAMVSSAVRCAVQL